MKKEAVLHIPLSQYAYAKNESTLVIRLRTAKDDVEVCKLYYGDRVDMVEPIRTTCVKMEKIASDDMFDYYEADVEDKYTRVCYYFELKEKSEVTYYYSRGFVSEMDCHRTEYFQFPYIRREDIIDIPSWANSVVMYHIFPDSFASEKKVISGEKKELDGAISHLGGTLKGIRENLDYIKSMGINTIYLNPIFRSNSYHKYDTEDYYEIDPCLGTKEDLIELVKECHQNEIRVILDGVFNHSGPNFFAFKDVLEHGTKSKYFDWFYQIPDEIIYADPPNYEAFAYVKEMPKLNTGNKEVSDYFCKVGEYWIKEADIDGWRLDVANEINHDFWRKFRNTVRAVKPDCFLIAEIWEDSNVWLLGDQFDSSMNYTFSYLCKDFFAMKKIKPSEFDQQIHKMIMRYPYTVSLAQMNFLDSHDVPRFLSYCNGDRKKLELAFFYLIMGVGIPSIFYGDECYIDGVTEPEYRQRMRWNTKESFYQRLSEWIAFRQEHSAIRDGKYITLLCDDENEVYGFARENEEERIEIYVNNSNKSYELAGGKQIQPMGYLIQNSV